MDGTAHSILHSTSLSLPYSLTLDYDTQVLYWADYALNKIERSNADGSNRRLVTTSLVYDPYSITFFNERLYWTDFAYNRILTFPTTSSSSATTTYLSASLGDMPGIQVLAKERQPEGHYFNNFLASQFSIVYINMYVLLTTVTNPCGSRNCSHFCLLSSTSAARYQCGCPDRMVLINGTNCGREYINTENEGSTVTHGL